MAEIRETEITGIFPGDFIIRTAIQQFLLDMRSAPDQLDVIWASFAQDELTNGQSAYGENQIQEAKDWFMKSEIPVFHHVRVPDNFRSGVFVTIGVGKETESYNTLGDSHWSQETSSQNQPFYTNGFVPTSFDVATGELGLPADVVAATPLIVGVEVFTRDGRSYPIVEILDDDVVVIENEGARLDLRDVRLRTPPESYHMNLEGMQSRQVYQLGCHSYQEPIHGLYLYAVVLYGLMKYREVYLEGRGFQGSFVDIGQFDVDPSIGELGYSRYFQLSGLVHQVWSKGPKAKVLTMNTRFRVQGAGNVPVDIDITSINDLLWIGDLDGLGTTFGSVPQVAGAAAAADLHLFFGTGPVTLLTAAEVELLTARTASQRQTSFTVVAGPGRHVFFAMPISFGDAIFQVGAFIGGFVVAASGLMIEGVAHRLYRSVHSGLGTVTVQVR